MEGFARVSVCVPPVKVGDVGFMGDMIRKGWEQAEANGATLVVFPELVLSGYTARDLFLDRHLQDSCLAQLEELVVASRDLDSMALIGLPLRVQQGIYNVAAAVQKGHLIGVIPKSFLPNHREFEERRWFRPGTEIQPGTTISLFGTETPFGTDLLFCGQNNPDFVVGVEICEDYWIHTPPSAYQVSAGASICCNLSASNFVLGKAETRRVLAQANSERGKCAYVYVAAGPGESSTDLAFDADAFIFSEGTCVAESKRFSRELQVVHADIDLHAIVHSRASTSSFGDCAVHTQRTYRRIPVHVRALDQKLLHIDPHPFLPSDPATLSKRCFEVFEIQTNALRTRMAALGRPKLVIGLSGGIDSTHAALVCAAALDGAGQNRQDLIALTMPGLGTTSHTHGNALKLAEYLGATIQEISIAQATQLILSQIEHRALQDVTTPEELIARLQECPDLGDVTLENTQARLRTLLLMAQANHFGGIVIGTGDLSEKALGWSTFAGDQIANYDLNAGVPKTLIQFVIQWVMKSRIQAWEGVDSEALGTVLASILDTPISPELLPPSESGDIIQKTEDTVGPYELHDFFLFHFVKHGCTPKRLLGLAVRAFEDNYPIDTIKKWLKVFLRRFFQQQFKRSCTSDGPKVLPVNLSPRGDWRMPSDASPEIWIAEVDAAHLKDP